MNNHALDQKGCVGSTKGDNTATKVQRRTLNSIPEGSILERLMDFAFSIPDFRRTHKVSRPEKMDYFMNQLFQGKAVMIAPGQSN